MIERIQQHAAEVYAVTCGSSIFVGINIDVINKYLQAGAFIIAMISGVCAAYYYLKKARREN